MLTSSVRNEISALGSGRFNLSDSVLVSVGLNFLLSATILDVMAIEETDVTVGDRTAGRSDFSLSSC